MSKKTSHVIFDQWLAAEAGAQQAQAVLSRALLEQIRGGPPVSQEKLDEARQMRLRADFLLPEVLDERKRLAQRSPERRQRRDTAGSRAPAAALEIA